MDSDAVQALPLIPIEIDPPFDLSTTVTVLAPPGGTTVVAQQTLTVQWDTQGPVDAHAVLLSQDGGASFTKVSGIADLPGAARSFSFTLPMPAAPSVQAVVRVRAKLGGFAVARSDSVPFTLLAANAVVPVIQRLVPTQGFVDQSVRIEGSGFSNARQVRFGSTIAGFRVLSDQLIIAGVPIFVTPQQGAVPVTVSVQTDAGTALSPQPFTVTPLPAPRIDRIEPALANPGDLVTLYGANLLQVGPAPTTVTFFNGVPSGLVQTPPGANGSVLVTSVPQGAQTGPVTVTTPGGSASIGFTVPVTVGSVALSVSPATNGVASGGTAVYSIALARSNFGGAVSLAVSGLPSGAAASISPNPATGNSAQLVVSTTAGATTLGTRTLTISGTANGVAVAPATASLSVGIAPRITSFDPLIGAAGTSVAIFGSGLASATQVRFNGVAASFIAASDGQLLATVPSGASTGALTVTTPFGTATGPGNFNVPLADPPVITGFTPSRGVAGTRVQINGRGFGNLVAADVGGAQLLDLVVNDSQTLITGTLPFNAVTGRILVRTATGTALSDGIFIVDIAAPPPPPPPGVGPTIAGFRPARGAPGTSITVVGSGFVAGGTSVSFNGAPAPATVLSPSQLRTIVPAEAGTGAITVSTPAGTTVSPGVFVVIGTQLLEP